MGREPVPTGLRAKCVRALIDLGLIQIITLLAILQLGMWVTWWLGVPAFLVYFLLVVTTVEGFLRTPLDPGEPIATLNARTEPELFTLFDDVCAQMGMPKVTQIDVIEDVNAYVWYPDGKHPRIGIGASLFATLNRTEMMAVLAHELGHAHAGDGRSFDDKCMRTLARIYLCCGPLHPLKDWLATRVIAASKERLPSKRWHELRADEWSAFVAGQGAVGASGRTLARCGVVFGALHTQLSDVARADGAVVDDLFPLLRAAWTRAGDAALDALVRGYGGDEDDPDDEHPPEPVRAAHVDRSVQHIGKHAPTIDDPIRNWLARPEETEQAWTRALGERWADRKDLKRIAPHLALLRGYALAARAADDLIVERAGNVAILDLPLSARLKLVMFSVRKSDDDTAEREWLVPFKIGSRTTTTSIKSFPLTPDEAVEVIAGLLFGGIARDTVYGKLELGMPARVWLGKTWFTIRFLAAELAMGAPERWRTVLDEVERYERAEKTDPNARALLPAWKARNEARNQATPRGAAPS